MENNIISMRDRYNEKINEKISASQQAGEEYQSKLQQFALKIENGKKITEKDADELIKAMIKTSKASKDVDSVLKEDIETIEFIP